MFIFYIFLLSHRSDPLYKRDQSDGPFISVCPYTLCLGIWRSGRCDLMQMPLGNSVCASKRDSERVQADHLFRGWRKSNGGGSAGAWKDSALTGTNNGKSMEQWCWMVPGRLGIPIVALGAAVKYGGGEGEKRRVRRQQGWRKGVAEGPAR